jgi:peptidoglycan/LPS O-acetylase OafA/YrhL
MPKGCNHHSSQSLSTQAPDQSLGAHSHLTRLTMAKNHIIPLTSIRGLAALMVVFAHCGFEHFWTWTEALLPYCWSNQAVDMFFVLSAFVLLHNYAGQPMDAAGLRRYLIARVARIYPLHAITMLLVGALALVALRRGAITGDYQVIHLVKQALLVNAWPIIGMERTWNYPAWSISIEWFLYLFVFPVLARLGAIKSAPTSIAISGLVMIASGLAAAHTDDSMAISTGWIALGRGVCGFVAGWCVWSLFAGHRGLCERLAQSADVWMGLGVVLVVLAGLQYISLWCLLPVGPVVIASLSVSSCTLSCRWMHTRAMQFLGAISYSLYMTHAVVGKIFSASIFRGPPIADQSLRLLAGCSYLAALIVLAWLIHRFVEMPARTMLRGYLERSTIPLLGAPELHQSHP